MSDDVAAIVEVALVGTRPAVRRVISIPYSLPLSRFHSVLQLVMEWGDREPHIFASEDLLAANLKEITDPDAEDESLVTIGELLPFIGAEALYLYDFATEWRHRLRLLDLESGNDQIALLKGSGRCPTEVKKTPQPLARERQKVAREREEQDENSSRFSGYRGNQSGARPAQQSLEAKSAYSQQRLGPCSCR